MDWKDAQFLLGITGIILLVIVVDYFLYLFLSQSMIVNNATDFYFATKNYIWLIAPPILGFVGVVYLVNYIDE